MEYKKLASAKVLTLDVDNGLIVELTENVKAQSNTLSIWAMYKAEDGTWQHKGTSRGATAIRLPLTKTTADYLINSIKALTEIETKYQASKPTTTPSGIDTTKPLTSYTAEELKQALEMLNKAGAVKTTPAPKEEAKTETVTTDTGLDITFDAMISKLMTASKAKKSKK